MSTAQTAPHTDKPSTQSLFSGGKPGEAKSAHGAALPETPSGTTPPETTTGKVEGDGKPAEGSSAAAKSETTAPVAKVDEDAKFTKKLQGFLRKAAAARQKLAVITPALVLDTKSAAKNADKPEYAPEDFILQYKGLVNLATGEELIFPIDK
jgi:hypothetical protein